MADNKKLVVIARHRPSVLLAKGEYIPRYYNPSDVFDEVHLLLTNHDQPDIEMLQPSVGRAKLFIHNLPPPDFRYSLGWSAPFIRTWIQSGIQLMRQIKPNLIRVHNNFLEAHLAQRIKGVLGIPYVVSIHHSDWQFKDTWQKKLLSLAQVRFEASSMQRADAVIAVYESNYVYVQDLGGNDPHLIYNMVSDQITLKRSYKLSTPPRLITINQQIKQKNPENILRAIAEIECEYWVVGNGPEHESLVALAEELGLGEKVHFYTGIPNQELTGMLPTFDLHISHCDVWGMSKTVVEASLAGLPTLINAHPIKPIPEYNDDWIVRCANTPESYKASILSLLKNQNARKNLGQNAHFHAKQIFDPIVMEHRLANLYRDKFVDNS